jgi:NADH-quinone oxidoreductase subunit F
MTGRFVRGGARDAEIDLLEEVAWGMVGRTICVLADAAALPTRSFVRKFRSEFEAAVANPPFPKVRNAHGGGH